MKTFEKFINILVTNIRRIFIFSVIIILFILGGNLAINIGNKDLTSEEYKILLGLIAIAISISGLSFRASSAMGDINEKKVFYIQGKRLFLAAILFIIAIASKYIATEKSIINYFPLIGVGIFKHFLWIYLPAFMGGLVWTIIAFISLYNVITTGIEYFTSKKL